MDVGDGVGVTVTLRTRRGGTSTTPSEPGPTGSCSRRSSTKWRVVRSGGSGRGRTTDLGRGGCWSRSSHSVCVGSRIPRTVSRRDSRSSTACPQWRERTDPVPCTNPSPSTSRRDGRRSGVTSHTPLRRADVGRTSTVTVSGETQKLPS